MINKIRKIIPKVLIDKIKYIFFSIKLFQSYKYDFLRYLRHSALLSIKTNKKLEGRIIAHYHVLEKGLSNNPIRLGFGREVLTSLIKLLIKYSDNNYDINNKQYMAAIGVIEKYIAYHKVNNQNLTEIEELFLKIKKPPFCQFGGILEINKEEIIKKCNSNFKIMALSRYSIRDLSNEDVDIKIVEEAISISMKSPSVCNRQATRIYIIKNKNDILKHLKYQNGNNGFSEKINKLLIVTIDLNYFEGVHERNQMFIDAGMFSMSLLYSFHYLKLGAVALNWCKNNVDDLEYRKFSNISESENIILMIGIGHLKEKFNVPQSIRKDLDEIIKYI